MVTAHDAVPAWFRRVLAETPDVGSVRVRDCDIHYRAWGPTDQSGVVLIHGGAAHASWWDHIGPFLADEQRVVALDLSGHGDSGHRDRYALEVWADEATAVTEDGGIAGPPVLIGHSMGGWVALVAAAEHGHRLAGAMAIDSPVLRRTPEQDAARRRRAFGPRRVYETRDAALSRFRTVPEQVDALWFVMDHLAATSVREVADGWTWAFDPGVFARQRVETPTLEATCRIALVRAEHGMVDDENGQRMLALLGRAVPVVVIPEAGHHVMIDQPLALVTALRALLADWRHSTPAST